MAEQSFVNCTSGGPIRVHVEDGKIVRVRPLVFDDDDAASWTLEVDGEEYTPLRKACVAAFTLTERARVYSEERILYPMKRVDFDPDGERNPQNRGKSGYERISWDEALDLVAGEMKRIRTQYGPEAITSRASSHHNWGNLGYRSAAWARFFNLIGFTDILDNPDSWEGWHWGATHAWGFFWRLGNPEHYDLLEDALRHTELIIQWGNDPDTTHGIYGGNDSAQWRLWLRYQGKREIIIDPFFNYTGAHVGDKWIAYRPGTTAALALAIAHVWLEEGTYDKDYVAARTLGFDDFCRYVLGEEDGVSKTPAWAAELTDVPARTIVSLARDWASHRTCLAGGTKGGEGGACRQAYATESARLLVLLQAMQGLGKPGVMIWGTANGPPYNATLEFPGYASGRVQPDRREAGREPGAAAPVPPHRARGHPGPADQLDGRGLLRQLHRAAVHQVPVPAAGLLRGQDVLPLRRRLPGHHDRHQPLGEDVPEPQAGVRRQPGLLVVHRDRARRRHPAGLHQPRAQRHRRVGELRRLLAARLRQRQPPRHHLPAEVRGAGG